MHKIVVWDPKGEYWDGSLVEERAAHVLAARGVVLLPVDVKALPQGGVAGFHKRAWGAGWPLDYVTPRMSCPLVVFVMGDHENIHWAYRLVPDPAHVAAARRGETFTAGVLRLVADTGQRGSRVTSISSDSPTRTGDLGKPDADGGWTVSGTGRIQVPGEGFYGFSLYGMLPGTRVAWAALTVTG